ncbi:MAG: hypothetical protein KDJ38_10705 [Gammaproteobacteria bacterium]|nr:hypothetical protein [Gammaproteobacteria bacterium]
MSAEPILLLDLDCVTIYGGNPRDSLPPEIYQLHPDMVQRLSETSIPVVLFTHRSRQEAMKILSFFAERQLTFAACISARELFYSALRQGRVLDLLRQGLSKKHGIRWVAGQFDTGAANLVLIDDKPENLKEVLIEGARVAVHAPFEIQDNQVTTFELAELFDILHDNPAEKYKGVIELTPVSRDLSSLPVIGEIHRNSPDLFESVRRFGRRARKKLS